MRIILKEDYPLHRMNEEKFQDLLEKIRNLKKSGKFDLSLEEDLSIAVMNLISLEEHFFFTAKKTGKEEYLSLLEETRNIRKKLLGRMINQHEGETWCITKHLLAATMRLIEVGTKFQTDGKKKEAEEVFQDAYKLYSIFWGVRLKLINLPEMKKISKKDDEEEKRPWSFEKIVEELVDCCDE